MKRDFLSEIRWRGLLYQATQEEELSAHLGGGRRAAYVGLDPTSDSLTIGNLVPLMLLMHLERAGHRPVVVVGGGTGLIGDPSGKSAERLLLTREAVEHNVEGQRRIYERLLDLSPGRGLLLNNADWLLGLGYLQVLRDVGKHFSVNAMIQRDSVRERLQHREQGISYTEFSYMILQAYDFLHLRREFQVTLQMGGCDQWGNIVSGCDLIRRMCPEGENDAFGLTAPLITRSDGGKFGKTEAGAIWLTADRTSPYAFYQFWLNSEDRDVIRYLKMFTFLEEAEIAELEAAHERDPGARVAHRALAQKVTEMLHGKEEREQAEAAARALFSGQVAGLSLSTLEEVFASVPSSTHDIGLLPMQILDVLALTSLIKSRREARELLDAGAVTVNGARVEPDHLLTSDQLLHGRILAVRRGKKSWHVMRFG